MSSTPSMGSSLPSGPMQNGITYRCAAAHTAAGRAGHGHRLGHLVGIDPVVGGASQVLRRAADVGARFDAGHVGRVGQGQERVGLLLSSSLTIVPASTRVGRQAVPPSSPPSDQTTRSGWVSSATSATQARRAAWLVGALVAFQTGDRGRGHFEASPEVSDHLQRGRSAP